MQKGTDFKAFACFIIIFLALKAPGANSSSTSKNSIPPFSFHLMGETFSIDPALLRGSSGSYLFHNLYRGLTRYDANQGLIMEGAHSCQWESELKLNCKLKKLKWSDGSPIQAQQYIKAFQRILNPSIKSVQTDLLVNLKNASKILAGIISPEELGIQARKKSGTEYLVFSFANKDPEFLFKLAQPVLSPIHSDNFPGREDSHRLVVNGPYKIKKWRVGKKIELTPNPYFPTKLKLPPVTVYFVDDDHTALRLYETGRLSLLRRLPTQHIKKFKKRKDFVQIPMARFDHIGFGRLNKLPKDFRKALALSLNYNELEILLSALGPPGCPSLPKSYMEDVPCHKFDLKTARTLISSLKKSGKVKSKYILQYSKMGGEDIRRQAEWVQNQWKKNLGLNVRIEPIEQGMFIKTLMLQPKDFFRKGLAIDRPTCLAGLETLKSGHRENFIQLNDPDYDRLVERLESPKLNPTQKARYCSRAAQHLIDQAYLIPMGEIHFSMLASPAWSGWTINELNQLNLSELQYSVSK